MLSNFQSLQAAIEEKEYKIDFDRLRKIYQDIEQYKFVIPLLDEPYQLALIVMEYPDLSDKEVARNWRELANNQTNSACIRILDIDLKPYQNNLNFYVPN